MTSKKWLALFLSLVMLCTAVGNALGDNVATPTDLECLHPNAAHHDLGQSHLYDYQDETYHTHITYQNAHVMICDDCGAVETDYQGLTSTILEEHVFNTTDCCTLCGYQSMPCEHANAYNDPSSPVATNARDYICVDDEYHEFICDMILFKYCPDCETYVGQETVEEGVVLRERHADKYPMGAECICGIVVPESCQHVSTACTEEVSVEYTSIDNFGHDKITSYYQIEYCTLCDAILNKYKLSEGYYNGPHELIDGNCVCGYSCDHDIISLLTTHVDGNIDAVPINQYFHQYTADIIEKTYCRYCDMLISSSVIEENVLLVQNHDLFTEDGTCPTCGWALSTCLHAGTYESYPDATYTDIGNKQYHQTTYSKVWVKCDHCGEILSENTLSEPITDLRYHQMLRQEDGSLFCTLCNGTVFCSHENTETIVSTTCYYGEPWIVIPDKGHLVVSRKDTSVFCQDCGFEVSSSHLSWDFEWEEEPHCFIDGVCYVCGQKEPTPTPEATEKPTESPAPMPTTAPTEEPTAEPTEEPTPEPTEEPTAAPTAEPTPEAVPVLILPVTPTATEAPALMVETLVGAVEELTAQATDGVQVEIVGVDQVLVDEELSMMKRLPIAEQVLVTLASIGFDDVVATAIQSMNVSLSDAGQSLMTQISARVQAFSNEEKTRLEAKLSELFPLEEITIGGKAYPYHIITLRCDVNGEITYRRYGFRLDENSKWVFVSLESIAA